MKKKISTDLTPGNIEKIITILASTAEHLDQIRAALPPSERPNPFGEGERTFKQNLAHLLNVEARSAESILLALSSREPLMAGIHPEKHWGRWSRYERETVPEILAYFKFRRRILLRILRGLSEKQWARTIREENKQRRESIYWRARGLALHEMEHLEDMNARLEG